jgi:hypothetical protein
MLNRIEQEADQLLGRNIKMEGLTVTKFKSPTGWRVKEKNY